MRVYLFWGKVSIPEDILKQWGESFLRVERKGDISALISDVSAPRMGDVLSDIVSRNKERLYEMSVAELFRLSRRFSRVERVKVVSGSDTFSYAEMEEGSLRPFLLKASYVKEARFMEGSRWVFYSHPFFFVMDGVALQHLLEAVDSKWRERAWKM